MIFLILWNNFREEVKMWGNNPHTYTNLMLQIGVMFMKSLILKLIQMENDEFIKNLV
jgi:hypothetical protein